MCYHSDNSLSNWQPTTRNEKRPTINWLRLPVCVEWCCRRPRPSLHVAQVTGDKGDKRATDSPYVVRSATIRASVFRKTKDGHKVRFIGRASIPSLSPTNDAAVHVLVLAFLSTLLHRNLVQSRSVHNASLNVEIVRLRSRLLTRRCATSGML